MVKHLLVPLEGNDRSEAVLPTVRRLDALGVGEITLLRADMPVVADEYIAVSETVLRDARTYLKGVQDRLSDLKAPVRILARIGPAASTILETAREKGATMILVAMARRARLVRFLFGNVTEHLIQRSTIPVLAVPPPWSYDLAPAQPASERPFRQILVPLDGRKASAGILPAAIDLARSAQARLLLLSVLSPGTGTPAGIATSDGADHAREEFENAEALLYAAGAACAEAGVDFSVILEHGDPVDRILAVCRDREADAIAMATRGRTGFTRWVAPSATLQVLRECNVPLLAIRAEARARAADVGSMSAAGRH